MSSYDETRNLAIPMKSRTVIAMMFPKILIASLRLALPLHAAFEGLTPVMVLLSELSVSVRFVPLIDK